MIVRNAARHQDRKTVFLRVAFMLLTQIKITNIIISYSYPPFYDTNPYDIYKRIAIGYYEFPANVSMTGRSLIAGLLEPDLSKRLGCLSGGAEDIKANTWFQGVDWNIVKQKRIQPPWIPELTGDQDF